MNGDQQLWNALQDFLLRGALVYVLLWTLFGRIARFLLSFFR